MPTYLLSGKPKLDWTTILNCLHSFQANTVVFTVLPNITSLSQQSTSVSSDIPAISSSVEEISSNDDPSLPPTLYKLYDKNYMLLSDSELLECGDVIFKNIQIIKEQADFLEKSTKIQSSPTIWFDHQKGHITVLTFQSVIHHKWKDYPMSSVMKIM